jgi:hypothetical protein
MTPFERELMALGVIPASHTPAQEPDDRMCILTKTTTTCLT